MARSPSARLFPRLLGELVVIIAGVLIALWMDGWAEERSERRAESAILERVAAEVEENRRLLVMVLSNIEQKQERLDRVAEGLRRPAAIPDTISFFRDVIGAANYGWGQPQPPRAAYDDLVGSGRLELIRDDELRTRIVAYYWSQLDNDERMSARLTAFAPTAHGLIPVQRLAEGGLSIDRAGVMATVLASSLGDQIIGEENRAWFLRGRLETMVAAAEELSAALEARSTGR